jgi:hypothetical protein
LFFSFSKRHTLLPYRFGLAAREKGIPWIILVTWTHNIAITMHRPEQTLAFGRQGSRNGFGWFPRVPLASYGIVTIKNGTAFAFFTFPHNTRVRDRLRKKEHRSSRAFVTVPQGAVFIVCRKRSIKGGLVAAA